MTTDYDDDAEDWANWNAKMMDECLNGDQIERETWERMGLILFREFVEPTKHPKGTPDIALMQWNSLEQFRRDKYTVAARVVIEAFVKDHN
jgi:hypothetical protein